MGQCFAKPMKKREEPKELSVDPVRSVYSKKGLYTFDRRNKVFLAYEAWREQYTQTGYFSVELTYDAMGQNHFAEVFIKRTDQGITKRIPMHRELLHYLPHMEYFRCMDCRKYEALKTEYDKLVKSLP